MIGYSKDTTINYTTFDSSRTLNSPHQLENNPLLIISTPEFLTTKLNIIPSYIEIVKELPPASNAKINEIKS